MSGRRKRYSADFKANVALDALRGKPTVSQSVSKHGVHQTLISAWRRQAVEGLTGVFSGQSAGKQAAGEKELQKLHAKIGQLLVERDFWRRHPVDEPGPETGADRAGTPGAVDCAAVPAAVGQPFGAVLAVAR